MEHRPERTCIGCRGVFAKGDVLRIVAGPAGAVLDYREKLPGRAAYVCARADCIDKALSREHLSRALHTKVQPPAREEFIASIIANCAGKIKSLIAMAAKAGKLSAGFSAVQDALQKGRVEMILYARDVSPGTREKISVQAGSVRQAVALTRDELGMLQSREMIGIVAFEDKGFADSVWKESERLKGLINMNE